MKFFDDLRNLDRNNVGGWPRSIKIFFMSLVLIVVLLGGWYFKISNQQDDLKSAVRQESSLKNEFANKQAQAVNLEALKKQLVVMQDMLHKLLRQLPSKTEMPQLLIDISQTALAAGIDTEVFQPQSEVPKEFYAEQPISVKMIGTYHQFGTFISNVASLPRVVILTMHDVSLKPEGGKAKGKAEDKRLVMQGIITTYHYLDSGADAHQHGKRK